MAHLVTSLIQLIKLINMQSATMFQKVSITKPTAAVRYVHRNDDVMILSSIGGLCPTSAPSWKDTLLVYYIIDTYPHMGAIWW